MSKRRPLPPFDRYDYYSRAVQSPESDVEFLVKAYRELRRSRPRILAEDFCGTFLNSCAWIRQGPEYRAVATDLDPEPLAYGREKYWAQLKTSEKGRLVTINGNVISPRLPKADIVAALNFSYFIFKDRKTMGTYFSRCLNRLRPKGLLVLDAFGGSACLSANEEETEHKGFSYFWDQQDFDPITHHAHFHIHFRRHGERKRERVFSYDWRLWTLPELRDLLKEVGFKASHVYWEGTAKNGDGNGVFTRADVGEECEAWIAYVVAEK